MKNIAIALLLAALGYGLAAAQQPGGEMAQETKKEMKTEKKDVKPARMKVCKGIVEAVDLSSGRITVKESKMSMIMPIGAEARIMIDSKPGTISDIMVGDKIHIKYEGDMANPVVKLVKVEKVRVKKDKKEKKAEKN